VYRGKDWHGFEGKALVHLIDYGSALHTSNHETFRRDVFHYYGATVTLETHMALNSSRMRTELEFIAESDARPIAGKLLKALKADPKKYNVRTGEEPSVPRSRRVRQA
jgi:hypothetical protein